jgi:hypothetical protein
LTREDANKRGASPHGYQPFGRLGKLMRPTLLEAEGRDAYTNWFHARGNARFFPAVAGDFRWNAVDSGIPPPI